jgi:hypothetical protein
LRIFAASILVQGAILGALETYWYKTSGGWTAPNLAPVLLAAWFNAFGAWRWKRIRQSVRDGTFNEEAYRSDPKSILLGPPKQKALLIATGVVLLVAWVMYDTIHKMPK